MLVLGNFFANFFYHSYVIILPSSKLDFGRVHYSYSGGRGGVMYTLLQLILVSIWFFYKLHTPSPPLFSFFSSTIFQPLPFNPNISSPLICPPSTPFPSLSPVTTHTLFIRVTSLIHVIPSLSKLFFGCEIVDIQNDRWKQILSLRQERCVNFFNVLYMSFVINRYIISYNICGPYNELFMEIYAFHTLDYG